MFTKEKWVKLLVAFSGVLLLTACGSSSESDIIGSWKAVMDDQTSGYLEITEERLISEEESVSVAYILTETQDDAFLLEIINPESGDNELLFEGYFENEDRIIVEKDAYGTMENAELLRVDNIAEEQEKDEIEREKAEKREAEEAEKERAAQQEQAEQEVVQVNPDELYQVNCAMCHGADLAGALGPSLVNIESTYSEEEIKDIIVNGTGSMPAASLESEEEVSLLAEWLVEYQE